MLDLVFVVFVSVVYVGLSKNLHFEYVGLGCLCCCVCCVRVMLSLSLSYRSPLLLLVTAIHTRKHRIPSDLRS